MDKKEIIIKVTNEKVFLNPTLSIPIQQTNIPIEHMAFSSHLDIYWKVEQLNFKAENKCLNVLVKDYSSIDIGNFEMQEPKKMVYKLHFEKFDWNRLEPLLMYYQLSKLKKDLYNIDKYNNEERDTKPIANSLSHIQEIKVVNPTLTSNPKTELKVEQIVEQKPILTTHTEEFWVYFSDSTFMLGYVTFKKYIKSLDNEIDFKIVNEHILAEFENIKFWFSKKLKSRKFKVVVTITLTDNIVTDKKATSKQIEKITPELIDNIKYQRTFALTKEPRIEKLDKSLFTAEDIFSQMNSEDIEGNVFKQSEKDILNFFLKESNIRNKKQLVYLSGKKQSENYKLRYTLYPHFGFLFFIEGIENNHFIWELLNSHATYIWSIEKGLLNVDLQYKRIEDIVNTIRTSGRKKYKNAYRYNHQDNDLIFRVINHEGVGSDLVDDFPKWKTRLNEQLT